MKTGKMRIGNGKNRENEKCENVKLCDHFFLLESERKLPGDFQ